MIVGFRSHTSYMTWLSGRRFTPVRSSFDVFSAKEDQLWQADLWILKFVGAFSTIGKDSQERTDSIIISTGKRPLMTWRQRLRDPFY